MDCYASMPRHGSRTSTVAYVLCYLFGHAEITTRARWTGYRDEYYFDMSRRICLFFTERR